MQRERIPDLISEIEDELASLDRLVSDVFRVNKEKPKSPGKRRIYEESLALKIHNFYTGCERIFQKVAEDINGGVPRSLDWHKRLLRTMALEIENRRPPVIAKTTCKALEEYLAFRHVVRNIYGFEIDAERLKSLIEKLPKAQSMFRKDVGRFIAFLRKLSK